MDQKELDQIGKDMVKEVPLLVRGQAAKAVESIFHADNNHDGKGDLLQLINFGESLVGPLAKLNDSIDFVKLVDAIDDHPAIKNKELLKEALHELAAAAELAQKLAPKPGA